ncbi:MAG: hypothetical protein MI864_05800 [Pseudomonadales bacterium]|nr:hypothetical protein [Pseudomonadales bacterium]
MLKSYADPAEYAVAETGQNVTPLNDPVPIVTTYDNQTPVKSVTPWDV